MHIHPATLMRIKSLELRAKHVVEGFWSGLNRSPHHGFSVEFTEYRRYAPGDDLRYLDWKLLARSDRKYIKRFEDETNLRCYIVLDLSRSMDYGSVDYTKADYARTLTATLAYFLTTQRDAVGLMTFDQQVNEFIGARFRPGHLQRLMGALERQVGGTATNLNPPLEQVAERVRKRGMLIFVSDLLAPVDKLQTSLGYLRARGHEVVLLQILDPSELTFDFDSPALFHDPESGKEIYVDPAAARDNYLDRFKNHMQDVNSVCDRLGVTLKQFRTDVPLDKALGDFLARRQSAAP